MRILGLLFFISFLGGDAHLAMAFTGTFGINYGRIADNIPSPEKVVTLLKAAKIKNVRIYDADHSVLNAFKGTGLELVIGLPNGLVKEMSASSDHALTWVKDNVQAFLPETHIVGIAVGNEVLGGGDNELGQALLGAVKNIHNATKQLEIDRLVQITSAHSQVVFASSYPPSSCTFTEGVTQIMKLKEVVFGATWSNSINRVADSKEEVIDNAKQRMVMKLYDLKEVFKKTFEEFYKLHLDGKVDFNRGRVDTSQSRIFGSISLYFII